MAARRLANSTLTRNANLNTHDIIAYYTNLLPTARVLESVTECRFEYEYARFDSGSRCS